jgi:TetR/AcrR family transcriptional regulator, lmrAB and yxaGH operons repressor
MVSAAAELLAYDGLEGTSFATVLARSGTPRGSIYHHFPHGKDQLVGEAVRETGAKLLAVVATLHPATPADAVAELSALWRLRLVASRTRGGCAVAAVTVGGDASIRPVASQVFADWRAAISDLLQRSGLTANTAHRFAVTLLAGIEGALVLCRAAGDLGPFDDAASDLTLLAEVLGSRN